MGDRCYLKITCGPDTAVLLEGKLGIPIQGQDEEGFTYLEDDQASYGRNQEMVSLASSGLSFWTYTTAGDEYESEACAAHEKAHRRVLSNMEEGIVIPLEVDCVFRFSILSGYLEEASSFLKTLKEAKKAAQLEVDRS